MAWFAIIDTASGRLHSVDEDPGALPLGFTAQLLTGKPNAETHEWNGSAFVPRPVPVVGDRLQDILTDPDVSWLDATAKAQLTTVLTRHLDPYDPGWRTYTT